MFWSKLHHKWTSGCRDMNHSWNFLNNVKNISDILFFTLDHVTSLFICVLCYSCQRICRNFAIVGFLQSASKQCLILIIIRVQNWFCNNRITLLLTVYMVEGLLFHLWTNCKWNGTEKQARRKRCGMAAAAAPKPCREREKKKEEEKGGKKEKRGERKERKGKKKRGERKERKGKKGRGEQERKMCMY